MLAMVSGVFQNAHDQNIQKGNKCLKQNEINMSMFKICRVYVNRYIWYRPAAPPPPVMVMVPFLVLVPAPPVGMEEVSPLSPCGTGGVSCM